MPLEGQIDHVAPYKVVGWARDPQTSDRAVRLVVTDNGEDIGHVIADHLRADLVTAGVGTGRYGFELRLPERLSPAARHIIRVHNEADGTELMYSPIVIEAGAAFGDADKQRLLELVSGQMSGSELLAAVDFFSRLLIDLKRRARSDPTKLASPAALAGAPHPRALIIDDRPPDETRDAGSVAIVSHARSLRRLGYEVRFIAHDLNRSESCSVQALEKEGMIFFHSPQVASVEELLRAQRDAFDLVYIHRVSNMSLYAPMVRAFQPHAKLVFGVADLHHLRFERQAAAEQRNDLPVDVTRRQEHHAAAQAASVLTHSRVEAELLRTAVPEANVHLVPWAVEANKNVRAFERRRHLAFLGGFSHAPNVAAARRLVDDIMPLVWMRDPGIKCMLIGPDLPSDFNLRDGIEYLGHVPDLFLPLNRLRLTVAPLTYGAGVKGKVLESLAHGLPCAMSEIAAEGMRLPPALLGCVARDDAAFADLILALHDNEELNANYAEAGFEFIKSGWSEGAVDHAMRLALGEIVSGGAPSLPETALSEPA